MKSKPKRKRAPHWTDIFKVSGPFVLIFKTVTIFKTPKGVVAVARSLKEIQEDEKRKLARLELGDDADDQDAESRLLEPIRADGKKAEARPSAADLAALEDGAPAELTPGEAAAALEALKAGVPPEIAAALGERRVVEVGGGSMTAYAQEGGRDGDLEPPRYMPIVPTQPRPVASIAAQTHLPPAEHRARPSAQPAPLRPVLANVGGQNKRLRRAAALLAGATIITVELAEDGSTITGFVVALPGEAEPSRFVIESEAAVGLQEE